MSRARSNKTIAQESIMKRSVKDRPLDESGAIYIDKIIERLIEKLRQGVADKHEQEHAATLLANVFFRRRGRPSFVVKPSNSGLLQTVELFAAEWMIETGSHDFANAVKVSIDRYTTGVSELDNQRPTFGTVYTYYKRAKQDRSPADISFAEQIERDCKKAGLTVDEIMRKTFPGEIDRVLAYFRYRHGRNCRARVQKKGSAR